MSFEVRVALRPRVVSVITMVAAVAAAAHAVIALPKSVLLTLLCSAYDPLCTAVMCPMCVQMKP